MEALMDLMIDNILVVMGAFLLGLASVAMRKILKHFGIKIDTDTHALLMDAARNGVRLAEEKSAVMLKEIGASIPSNEKLDIALEYIETVIPKVDRDVAEKCAEAMCAAMESVGATGMDAVR